MNRTDRLYAIVEELRGRAPDWMSAASLAERFEVSTRTIERDLSALQQAGVPIYATPGRRGGYAIDTTHTLPPLNLTPGEVAAIATALSANGPTPFDASGRSALRKILAVLRDVDVDGARALAQRIYLYDDKRPARPRPPSAVEHAILEARVVTIAYVDRTGVVSDRTVEPLALVGDAPHWYLWGWCRLREAPRAFRIDRIRGAVMHEEAAPDRGLDVGQYFPIVRERSILGDG
ncbi:MAG: helix-turn-helix transcriptional regulator [Acidimicrobiales bacterium]